MTLGPLLIGIYVFVLAGFVGFEMITKVPPTLHTPLMSGANAISGITVVGAIAAATTGAPTVANILGALAIVTATINVVGGFLVTDRMLRMFGKKKKKKPKALKPGAEVVAAQSREAVSK
ncbi:MAG: NAD(P) transhydrogenase subunit alpha [Polyangiales bacterium]